MNLNEQNMPCRKCVFKLPYGELVGSRWRGKHYYFLLGGKQFFCVPQACSLAVRIVRIAQEARSHRCQT